MRTLAELVGLDRDTPPEVLEAEIAERQALLPSPVVLFIEEPDSEIHKQAMALESEIFRLREQLDWVGGRRPLLEAGFEAGIKQRALLNALKANAPWAESRAYCCKGAAELWAKPPILRIGEVARAPCLTSLHGEDEM